jgi:hypothetical protein
MEFNRLEHLLFSAAVGVLYPWLFLFFGGSKTFTNKCLHRHFNHTFTASAIIDPSILNIKFALPLDLYCLKWSGNGRFYHNVTSLDRSLGGTR